MFSSITDIAIKCEVAFDFFPPSQNVLRNWLLRSG
jgi:hypothetical protein